MNFIGKAHNIQQEVPMKCSVQSGEVSTNVFEACVGLGTALGESVREAGRGRQSLTCRNPLFVHQDGEDSRAF